MQTPPEIRRLLDASDEPVRTLLLCAVLTGMRRPPSALAGEVRHTEVPALASDDRPSADAASGVGQALEPLLSTVAHREPLGVAHTEPVWWRDRTPDMTVVASLLAVSWRRGSGAQ